MDKVPIERLVLRATYAALLEAGQWRPIEGCPGRMVLPAAHDVSPAELLGRGTVEALRSSQPLGTTPRVTELPSSSSCLNL